MYVPSTYTFSDSFLYIVTNTQLRCSIMAVTHFHTKTTRKNMVKPASFIAMRIYVQLAIPSQPITNKVFVWPGIWLMCICLIQPVTFLVGSRGATGSSTNSANWCVHGNSSDLSLGASLISCLLTFTKWLQEETGYLRENTVVLKFSVRPLNYYQKCKDLTLWVVMWSNMCHIL